MDAVQQRSFIPELIEPINLFAEMLAIYDKAAYVAINESGQVVAYVIAHPSNEGRDDYEFGGHAVRGDEDCLYIHDLCVDPAARGRGLANSLFERMVVHARAQGYKNIIGIAVQGAAPFWQKLGFTMAYPYVYKGKTGQFMKLELQ